MHMFAHLTSKRDKELMLKHINTLTPHTSCAMHAGICRHCSEDCPSCRMSITLPIVKATEVAAFLMENINRMSRLNSSTISGYIFL